jgi:Protein of unknown function (DUF1501)
LHLFSREGRLKPFRLSLREIPISILKNEDARLLDRYGNTLFGNNSFIARRLVEKGVRIVNVTARRYATSLSE